MFILEVEYAVYKRLTGYPLDSRGLPLLGNDGLPVNREVIAPPGYSLLNEAAYLPSYGIRIPTMKPPFRGQRGLTSKDPDALRMFSAGFDPHNFRQIPVFDQNLEGRQHDDVYPSVSFRWSGGSFDPSVFVYHDPFCAFDPVSPAVDIRNELGEVVQTGRGRNLIRPHPESWPLQYVIQARAKNTIELQLICAQIIKLFPARGAIEVEFQSGEKHACDMLYLRTDTLDDAGQNVLATQGGEEQRGFSRAYVYQVESYEDNTTNEFGADAIRAVPNIVSRILEISDLQMELLQSTFDLNLKELVPLTA